MNIRIDSSWPCCATVILLIVSSVILANFESSSIDEGRLGSLDIVGTWVLGVLGCREIGPLGGRSIRGLLVWCNVEIWRLFV